jgi:hypothetical protein
MPTLKKQRQHRLALLLFSGLLLNYQPVLAEQPKSVAEALHRNHASHQNYAVPQNDWRGVFYGFVPCGEEDCPGVKMTLSLNANNNYTLVVQKAKESVRELYEKGKYEWSDEKHQVFLTPRKGKGVPRQYAIEDEDTLLLLNDDGTRVTGSEAKRYVFNRSDTVKSREVHLH